MSRKQDRNGLHNLQALLVTAQHTRQPYILSVAKMNLGVYQCYSSKNQLTRHALPALILGELWVFEQQLESRPYRGSCCFSAVDGIRAKREAGSNGLVNVDHCNTSHVCEKMITIHDGNSVLLLTLFQLKRTSDIILGRIRMEDAHLNGFRTVVLPSGLTWQGPFSEKKKKRYGERTQPTLFIC